MQKVTLVAIIYKEKIPFSEENFPRPWKISNFSVRMEKSYLKEKFS